VACRFSHGHDFSTETDTITGESSYNITITTQVPKDEIDDESEVTCRVQIPNTEYEAKDTVTYDGMKNFQLISAHNSNFF
jgi:hypothetical protein